MIGKLQRVPLREVWKDEARDFTPWLQANIDVLNDVLDFTVSNVEREQSAGDFSADLTAEDESGNTVIIENQLEKSDHDHLGKLITYLTAIEAKSAIWITSDPRPEHVNAINWLNDTTVASFYLIKVEAIKIGGSLPAPLLTLIVGPSAEGKAAGATKKDIAERYEIRYRFWSGLLGRAKTRTQLHASIFPGQYSYIQTGAGKYGISYNYTIRKHDAYVELYIDRGDGAEKENKAIFDKLHESISTIEQDFGEPLEWQRLEGKRVCRIMKTIDIGGYRDDESKWPEIQDAMIDAMIRLEKALRPHIENLKL
jgi:hypothetical protein